MWCQTSGQLQKTECKLESYGKLWLDVFAAMHFGSRSWLLSFSVYVLLKNQSFIFCLFVCFLGWTLFIIYLNQMTSHYVTLLTCSNTRLTDDVTSDHVTTTGSVRRPASAVCPVSDSASSCLLNTPFPTIPCRRGSWSEFGGGASFTGRALIGRALLRRRGLKPLDSVRLKKEESNRNDSCLCQPITNQPCRCGDQSEVQWHHRWHHRWRKGFYYCWSRLLIGFAACC